MSLGLLVGLFLGLLGGGGSILANPIFIYVAGMEPKEAIILSQLVVGATSLLGSVSHWRAGRVQLGIALQVGLWSLVGTELGTRGALLVSGTFQLVVFALVMLGAAAGMLRPPRPASAEEGQAPPLASLRIAGMGLLVGGLTGLVGAGGGFLLVPVLTLLGGLPMGPAVGTSLLLIATNSLFAFARSMGSVEVPWGFSLGFIALATLGSVLGSRLVEVVPERSLKRGFAVFLIGVASLMLAERVWRGGMGAGP